MPASAGTGYDDRGIGIIAIFWVESLTAIFVVGLRFYGRLMTSKIGRDDWMMAIALSLFIIYSGFATYLANELSFRHIEDMFDLDRILAVKYNYANQEWATVGVVVAKLSIALQLIRIIGVDNKWTRWALYLLIGSLGVFSLVDCVIMFAQCSPPRALWDSAIPHTCWDPNVRIHYAIFVASWNVFADFVFAALPIRFILQETTTLEQRISTALLLALGFTAGAFGIVKATFLRTMNVNTDITWDIYSLYVWTSLEYWMIMISGSLPPIRALILSILSPPKKVRFSDFDIPDGREHKKPLGQFRSLDRAVVGRDGDTVGLRSHGAMITAEQMRNCVSPIDRIVQMTDIRIESEPAGPVALELHTL